MQLVESIASLIIGLAVIAFLSRVLRLQYQQWEFSNPRRAAIVGILVVSVNILIMSLLVIMLGSSSATGNAFEDRGPENYTCGDVLGQAVVLLIVITPILIAMRTRKETWASAGITRQNLLRSGAVGLIVVAIQMVYLAATAGFHRSLVTGHFWAFLQYTVVGFAEEFMFRGYLQTRVCAWLGKYSGWLITSVIMALSHFAHRMTFEHQNAWAALASCAGLIPISLLFGYLYQRTGNIMAPGIAHTFANWIETL